ncbi:MAG: HlyD family efflux transporter periplasmic adaptor subunit, partial [Bacteroidales bacterium]|nr:HlyD family efflux transporter periplasmic adaptor subunit [Bacteroidales bacterium]
GSVIAVMSPKSKLIGEVYIKPKDIAFIHVGQAVQFRMESFPPREWGTASGEIYDISDDFLLMGKLPVYRVKSTIRDTCLSLTNGYTGHLKKGMSFQARCLIIPRSLFQLLLDKSVNWLQP